MHIVLGKNFFLKSNLISNPYHRKTSLLAFLISEELLKAKGANLPVAWPKRMQYVYV